MSKVIRRDIAVEAFVSHYHSERPIDWDRQFGVTRPLDVEIGCGLGDFLLRTAQSYPDRNFVGIEMDWQRVKKTLHKIDKANKISSSQNTVDNVRVLQIEANVAFSRLFAPSTVQGVYCLFPCPWPKKNHVKHRLFSNPFLKLLNSRLVEQGQIKIVTDYYLYFEWIQNESHQAGFQIETRTVDPQFDTKYERKWCEGGQTRFFELNLIKSEHVAVPVEEDVPLQAYFSDHFQPKEFEFPNVVGEFSVILKDFIFDASKEKGLVHLVVAEKSITQHLWIIITRCERGWYVAKAEGHTAIPTRGVAQAIRLVYEQVKRTGQNAEMP